MQHGNSSAIMLDSTAGVLQQDAFIFQTNNPSMEGNHPTSESHQGVTRVSAIDVAHSMPPALWLENVLAYSVL